MRIACFRVSLLLSFGCLSLLALSPAARAEVPVKVQLGSPELTSGIPGKGSLSVEQIREWLAKPENHRPLEAELPLGLLAGQMAVQIPAASLQSLGLSHAQVADKIAATSSPIPHSGRI